MKFKLISIEKVRKFAAKHGYHYNFICVDCNKRFFEAITHKCIKYIQKQ